MCSTSDCFFFNDTATTEIYTLSLHDALPIYRAEPRFRGQQAPGAGIPGKLGAAAVKSVTIARNYAQALLLAAQAEGRSEEHTSELQSRLHLVCRLLLEKKKLAKFSPAIFDQL